MTTITALPDAPTRADPTNFSAKGDALMTALPTFVTEVNLVAGEINTNATSASTSAGTATTQAGNATAQAGFAQGYANAAAASAATALNAPGTTATSTSSLSIGTGSKSLTIQTGKSIAVGASVIIAYTATPTTRMSGAVTAYDSGTGALTVTVDATSGSGTYTAWTVSLGSVIDSSAFATLTGTQTLTNKTIEGGTFSNGYTEETVTANTGTAYTIDLANGTVQILTLTGNCTYTFPANTAGKSFLLVQKQDGTGSRTVTWDADVKWPASTAPTITGTASKADVFAFTCDGTYWYGRTIGQNYL
jgi:hypothetical protein